MIGPATTSITARPPPGPARGSIASPVWLVLALTTALVLFGSFALLRGYLRRRRE